MLKCFVKENITNPSFFQQRSEKSELLLRGLNVIALNEVSGEVMSSRWFDTYAIKADSDNLMDYLRGLKDGRIICFAVRVTITLRESLLTSFFAFTAQTLFTKLFISRTKRHSNSLKKPKTI